MILSFHPCFDTDIQIILGDRALDSDDLEFIKKAEAIILPQACTQNLYEICAVSGASLFPRYEARTKYPGKVGQSLMFEDFQLRIPGHCAGRVLRISRKHTPLRTPCPTIYPFWLRKT